MFAVYRDISVHKMIRLRVGLPKFDYCQEHGWFFAIAAKSALGTPIVLQNEG